MKKKKKKLIAFQVGVNVIGQPVIVYHDPTKG